MAGSSGNICGFYATVALRSEGDSAHMQWLCLSDRTGRAFETDKVMRLMRLILVALLLILTLSGCQSNNVRHVSSPYSSGANHTEPVFYNGKHYRVSFRFQASANVYQMQVSGKNRPLGGTSGDRQVVEQVASSALRHFACPTGQRGHIVPGTARHGGGTWSMTARCA